ATRAARAGFRARRVSALRSLVPRDVDPRRAGAQQPASRVRRAARVRRVGWALPAATAARIRSTAVRSPREPARAALRTRCTSARRHLAGLALAACTACARHRAPAPDPANALQWLGSWTAAQQLVDPRTLPPAPGLTGSTLRQVIHLSVGGPAVRVRFSNAFSGAPLSITAAH